MPDPVTVLKLGGDALATPSLIAAAARRVVAERDRGAVVVVTSARRGVTDHLVAMARDVAIATGGGEDPACADEQAIAAGEVVTAALLAAALARLGVVARPLDARDAGILGGGPPGGARLRRIRRARLRSLLAHRITPVVTGFQVADRGAVRVLGRGGSDVTAVALAAALGATCTFYKAHGLRLADPAHHPDAPAAGRIDHAALATILADGARVLHPAAARLAARHGVPLRFVTFPDDGPESWVTADETGEARGARSA